MKSLASFSIHPSATTSILLLLRVPMLVLLILMLPQAASASSKSPSPHHSTSSNDNLLLHNNNNNNNNNEEVSNTIITLSQNHRIQKQQQEAHAESQRLQNLADASTGTVAYGNKDQAPVSCNEIMANAVIVASEEKEKALMERDSALAEARREMERANLFKDQIGLALEDAKNATIEYEALRLMTDRLVEDVKKTAKEELLRTKEEHVLAMQAVKDEMEALKHDFSSQKDAIKDSAAKEMERLKQETADKIESINLEAKQRIAKMEGDVKDQKEQARKEVEKAKMEAEDRIESMKEEYNKKENEIQQITSSNIQSIQDKSMQDIENMKAQVALVNEEMDALKKSTKEKIDSIHTETNEKIRTTVLDAQQRESAAYKKAHKVERDAEDKMEKLRKDVDKEIKQTGDAARKEYERIKREAQNEISKLIEEHDNKLEEKEREIMRIHDDAHEKETNLQNIITSLKEEIEQMKNASANLDSRLSSTKDELKYWKEVALTPVYVNTTLIMTDTKTYLSRISLELNQKAHESFDNGKTKVQEVSKPHIEKLTKTFHELYDEHMKEPIDINILPLYNKHIVPLREITMETYQNEVIPQIQKHVIPQLEELNHRRKNFQEQLYTKACDVYHHGAQTIRAAIEVKEATDSIPEFFLHFLERVENAPSSYVDAHFKILIILIVYLLRYTLLSLVWKVVTMPFRFVWFFCPLRLLIRGGKKNKNKNLSRKGKNKSSSKDDSKINGYSGVVKVKNEENGHTTIKVE